MEMVYILTRAVLNMQKHTSQIYYMDIRESQTNKTFKKN